MGDLLTKTTLSFRMSETFCENHNLRKIYVPHVNPEKTAENKYYVCQTKEYAYNLLFSESVNEYNRKQSRADRKIKNYLEKIIKAEEKEKELLSNKRAEGASYSEIAKFKKAKKSAYEVIVSLGNIQQNPEFASDGEKAEIIVKILDEYIKNFCKRNTNIYMYLGAIHADEQGVIHAHIDLIFFSDSYSAGLSRRVSLNKALTDMGFHTDQNNGKFDLAITKWENRERDVLTQIAKKYNIEVVKGNQSRQHIDREKYIIKKKKEEMHHCYVKRFSA